MPPCTHEKRLALEADIARRKYPSTTGFVCALVTDFACNVGQCNGQCAVTVHHCIFAPGMACVEHNVMADIP